MLCVLFIIVKFLVFKILCINSLDSLSKLEVASSSINKSGEDRWLLQKIFFAFGPLKVVYYLLLYQD